MDTFEINDDVIYMNNRAIHIIKEINHNTIYSPTAEIVTICGLKNTELAFNKKDILTENEIYLRRCKLCKHIKNRDNHATRRK